MGPRADFTCRAKRCQQDGAATVYEDLPIETKFCPVCRSKRITRLYNHVPGMIRPGGRHLQHVIDGAGAEAQLKKSDNTDARLQAAKRQAPALAVPMSKLAGTLAQFGARLTDGSGGSRPSPGAVSHPALSRVIGRQPTVGPGTMRDTQHRIVNGKVVSS